MENLYTFTWWFIPLSKWVITPVISGLTLLIPFITEVITPLLSGMSHEVLIVEKPLSFNGVYLVSERLKEVNSGSAQKKMGGSPTPTHTHAHAHTHTPLSP